MALQLLTVQKRLLQPLHNIFFFLRQRIRFLRINRREILIQHFIDLSADFDSSLLVIDMMQQISVFHLKSRILLDDLPFDLELNNRDRLMHLNIDQHLVLTMAGISF